MKPYYEQGGITIYHADCRDVLPMLEAGSVDLVLTDPPYFLPVQSYVGSRRAGYSKRMLGDTSILSGYFDLVFGTIEATCKNSASYYVFCDGQSYPVFYQVLFPFCSHVRPLIWDKVVSYNGYTWRHQHELITWGEKADSKRVPTGDGDVLKCRGVLQKDRLHPAEKPVELMGRLITKHADAAVVVDPWCGSGPTLLAAQQLGRRAIGIEIEERYCEIAARRLQQAVLPLGVTG